MRPEKLGGFIKKSVLSLKRDGIRKTVFKAKNRLSLSRFIKKTGSFYFISEDEKKLQTETVFKDNIKFSIVVPLYNTPINFLEEMIASVMGQTYGNWELCLADGSDEAHRNVGERVALFMAEDKRIRYHKLYENLGISENTNACIKMAEGDYIALFDHDDILHPSALFEMAKAVSEQNADFLYTDECTFTDSPENAFNPHFKPDFSPETLRSCNYICHFTAFSRRLLDKTGGFRKEFDGSQDYDMILRLTEQAERIVHIPRILYFWRAHGGSVAFDVSAKPYTVISAKKAISEHLSRCGIKGQVLDAAAATTYHIDYETDASPEVMITVPCGTDCGYIKNLSGYERINIKEIKEDGELSDCISRSDADFIIIAGEGIRVITEGWIKKLMGYFTSDDVGAVGIAVYDSRGKVISAGIERDNNGMPVEIYKGFDSSDYGYFFRLTVAQDITAVSSSLIMIRKEAYKKSGGYNMQLKGIYRDCDFCLRMSESGYRTVWTPFIVGAGESRTTAEDSLSAERFINLHKNKRYKSYYNPALITEGKGIIRK